MDSASQDELTDTQDIAEVTDLFASVGTGASEGQLRSSFFGQLAHDVPAGGERAPQQQPGQPSGASQAQASEFGQPGQHVAADQVRGDTIQATPSQTGAASGSSQPAPAPTRTTGPAHELARYMGQGRRPETNFGQPYYFSRSTPPGYKFRVGDLQPSVTSDQVSRASH